MPDSPRAAWDSSYGEMLSDPLQPGTVAATYYEGDGRLTGTLDGRTYSGVWYHPDQSRNCSERYGTTDWGRFEFTFNASFKALEGTWGYCDGATSAGWDGTKK
jgi:hypothetical protein